jgi:hypothetical protein
MTLHSASYQTLAGAASNTEDKQADVEANYFPPPILPKIRISDYNSSLSVLLN